MMKMEFVQFVIVMWHIWRFSSTAAQTSQAA